MKREREPWYESEDPGRVARGASWRFGLWVAAVVAFVALIAATGWVLSVVLAEPKGAGDAHRRIHEGDNRIAQQELFEELYANVRSYDARLGPAKRLMDDHPGDDFHASNYQGLVQVCLDAVEEYNAQARKISAAKWRSDDLPYQIDPKDPKTDCKP